jgi:hypothetical protein
MMFSRKKDKKPEVELIKNKSYQDFNQVIDLFPTAAYSVAHVKNLLEELKDFHNSTRPKDDYPESDHLATDIGLVRIGDKYQIWVYESWVNANSHRVYAEDAGHKVFEVSEQEALQIFHKMESENSGHPESGF